MNVNQIACLFAIYFFTFNLYVLLLSIVFFRAQKIEHLFEFSHLNFNLHSMYLLINKKYLQSQIWFNLLAFFFILPCLLLVEIKNQNQNADETNVQI